MRGGAREEACEARFYLDEDVPHGSADIGASLGLDILAAKDAQPILPQDHLTHLLSAGKDHRIMVTYNRNDFLVATRDAFRANLPHAGLLILTRKLPRDPARVAHALDQWVAKRLREGSWLMQPFEVAFLSD